MLKAISELEFTDSELLIILIQRRFCAVCPDSGAMLFPLRGNPRSGNAPRYRLILPNRSIEERGGLLEDYDWDYPHGRKFLRAWSHAEAIELANKRLEKMMNVAGKLT